MRSVRARPMKGIGSCSQSCVRASRVRVRGIDAEDVYVTVGASFSEFSLFLCP